MTHAEKLLVGLVGSLVLCTGVKAFPIGPPQGLHDAAPPGLNGAGPKAISAGMPASPYQAIVDRNVFGLKPAPVAPPPAEPPKPPPPKLILTGITTVFGPKRAILKANLPAKPGEPAKETSYFLTVGQRDGDVEVLEIDEIKGMVKVDDFGVITNLTFDKDGVKVASTPAPPSPAGAGGGRIPPPNPFNPAGGGMKSIPTRSLRLPGAGGGASMPTSGAGMSAYGATPTSAAGSPTGGPTVNLGGLLTDPNAAAASANGTVNGLTPDQQAASQRSAEETVALYEANRLKNDALRAAGARIPRMPQHPYLNGQQGAEAEQAAQQQQQEPQLPFPPGGPQQWPPQ